MTSAGARPHRLIIARKSEPDSRGRVSLIGNCTCRRWWYWGDRQHDAGLQRDEIRRAHAAHREQKGERNGEG